MRLPQPAHVTSHALARFYERTGLQLPKAVVIALIQQAVQRAVLRRQLIEWKGGRERAVEVQVRHLTVYAIVRRIPGDVPRYFVPTLLTKEQFDAR